ncbi:hypothetical protein [Leifsonia xyli]|uniref:hypothetical protein n=1 Tax=Leifsonia xyli TaxID=1575 RepID=UPI0003F98F1A|nr:hypothetical protein [Leifsonia xyli]
MLSFEQVVVRSNGKVLKPRKEDLKKHPGIGRGRRKIVRVTQRAIENAEDLMRQFSGLR